MLRFLSAAILAVCFCAPVSADPAPCETLADSIKRAEIMADKNGVGFVQLDGIQAQTFLDQFNAIEPVSNLHFQHIGLFVNPDRAEAILILTDGPCGGYGNAYHMPLAAFMAMYVKARGLGV